MGDGFSFASVILSYFLTAGGLFTGMLVAGYIKSTSEAVMYLLIALGSFLGGFVAARASRGSTIVEPAIGAVLVIGTIVGLFAGTGAGKLLWSSDSSSAVKAIALLGGSSAIGALGGAFVSEKFFGEATLSPFPWIIYSALSTFGACLIATLVMGMVAMSGEASIEKLIGMMFAGMGVGCLLGGVACGASARTRPLGASFLGGAAGVAGYFLLLSRGEAKSHDAAAGIAILAAGGAIVTLIGALIGWFAVGKKKAG